jgi:hypothetical protein
MSATQPLAAALGTVLGARPVRYSRPPLPGWLVELALAAPELVDDDTLLAAEDAVIHLERDTRDARAKFARREAGEIVARLKDEGVDFGGEAGEKETQDQLTDLAACSGDRARRKAVRFTAVEPALPPDQVRAARFYVSQNPELYDRFGGGGQEVFLHALQQIRQPATPPT